MKTEKKKKLYILVLRELIILNNLIIRISMNFKWQNKYCYIELFNFNSSV